LRSRALIWLPGAGSDFRVRIRTLASPVRVIYESPPGPVGNDGAPFVTAEMFSIRGGRPASHGGAEHCWVTEALESKRIPRCSSLRGALAELRRCLCSDCADPRRGLRADPLHFPVSPAG